MVMDQQTALEHQMALSGCGEKCPVQRKMRRVAGI